MGTRARLAALTALLTVAACGGNVVVDQESGAAGAGGTGPGPGSTGSYPTTGSYTTGSYPTTGSYTSTGSYPTTGSYTSSYVSSTSTGTTTECDVGDCSYCQPCSLEGPCKDALIACFSDMECALLIDCLQICGDGTDCYDQCLNDHPEGLPLYGVLVDCVLCQSCYSSCGAC